MGFLSLLRRPFAAKAVEGQPREGPWYLPLTGAWLGDAGRNWNWWQLGYSPVPAGCSAMVEACISAYAQTIAMCPGDHWRTEEDGGRKRIATSALSRILRKPNDYQNISDFLLNLTWSLLQHGNAYALALRNDRGEIDELHLMSASQSSPRLAVNGDIFYQLAGNPIIERRLAFEEESGRILVVPARDVLHVRLRTPQHPLVGESPLRAAALAEMASGAMLQQQVAFYLNQGRPSNVLATDQKLTVEQTRELRTLWEEQSKGLNAGGTPILTAGLKPVPISITPQDAQLAEIMRLTDQQVALAFRVPLQILGIGGGPQGGAKTSTESLTKEWKAQGLGFALNHIEEAFGQLFGLRGQPDEYVELSTDVLLRPSMKERFEALAAGTLGGILAPDEARATEGLRRVPGGHGAEPRMQAQVVPLSAAASIPSAPTAPAAPAAPSDPNPDDPSASKQSDFDPAALRSRLRRASDNVAA